jgi:hypothetical protein
MWPRYCMTKSCSPESATSTKLFKKFPHHFELMPAGKPNQVRFILAAPISTLTGRTVAYPDDDLDLCPVAAGARQHHPLPTFKMKVWSGARPISPVQRKRPVAGRNQNEAFSPKQSLPVPVQFRRWAIAKTPKQSFANDNQLLNLAVSRTVNRQPDP